jgi:SAM-dependent methyltransferase
MNLSFKKRLGLARELLVDSFLFCQSKLSGKNYADFYAARMDRRVKMDPNWGLNLEKSFQLKYLESKGLNEKSKFLDFGCGAISAGRYFIQFLDKGNYTGVDVSKNVLEEANNRVDRFNLSGKEPILIHVPGGDISILNGEKFDYILAQSVFTHMPPDEIEKLLEQMKELMHDESEFYATFVVTDNPNGFECKILKDWYYSPSYFKELASRVGVELEFMDDWVHADGADIDKMAKFSLKR